MGYPESVDRFGVKLNKKLDGGSYQVEEALPIVDGKFEGLLAHDNITAGSVRVYTGPAYSGEPVATFVVSTPGDAPWRRIIRVYAGVGTVYVSYSTPGDTVEADDINALQAAVTATQEELERYKAVEDVDGGAFYEGE
ncbi:phosphoglucomutase [Paenibacillus cymbidii]|uniref:phosphoglucomutase n=1 Tax=Paenibacillus cymbidii TaxID=1639034 RepID=UPI0010812E6C|nr:phosphoglucomutase [Paenibacillus cymbidii]